MGKSELAKTYAKKNEKKYSNIIHLFYDGDLKKCVAQMEISDDTADMSEDILLDRHMKLLKSSTLTVSLSLITSMSCQKRMLSLRNL